MRWQSPWRGVDRYFAQRRADKEQWHSWRAWHPVWMKGWVTVNATTDRSEDERVPDHFVWLETIERRGRRGLWWYFDYRYPGTKS